jgi:indolepyruvate ferredoxin oxidoreductase, alpha subunit
MLGNEAIAQACLEAGVSVASTYPGTPSSEIGAVLEARKHETGLYFEISTNEKVALEVAAAAAVSGLRSLVFFKHVGLNVASDPFVSLGYNGVRAGMVVLTADDPSLHSSQNEQDSRYYARLSLLPMLEPSTPAEAHQMVIQAYELSEKLEVPVVVRTSTRVNHARGVVKVGEVKQAKLKGSFEKDPSRFVLVPANARRERLQQLDRLRVAASLSEDSPLNFISGDGQVGVIASGVAYAYVREHLKGVKIFKIGFSHPLPERKIERFISGLGTVVIAEELSPLLELEVIRLAKMVNPGLKVVGKLSGHLPFAFEYSPDTLRGLRGVVETDLPEKTIEIAEIKLPPRPPVLCAGCPHRATFYAVRKALGKRKAVFSTDIGCYTLGVNPPMSMADYLLCMGSSVGAASGFSQALEDKVIAYIGDSTLFHSGIPGIVNAVFNDHRFLLVILDNGTTAMTGHQPTPGTGRSKEIACKCIDIEAVVRGCGVEDVYTIDPYDIKGTTALFSEVLSSDSLSVVISRHVCPLAIKKKGAGKPVTYQVTQEKCVECKTCIGQFTCPALALDGKKVRILSEACSGCGCCAQVCPKQAIGVVQ